MKKILFTFLILFPVIIYSQTYTINFNKSDLLEHITNCNNELDNKNEMLLSVYNIMQKEKSTMKSSYINELNESIINNYATLYNVWYLIKLANIKDTELNNEIENYMINYNTFSDNFNELQKLNNENMNYQMQYSNNNQNINELTNYFLSNPLIQIVKMLLINK